MFVVVFSKGFSQFVVKPGLGKSHSCRMKILKLPMHNFTTPVMIMIAKANNLAYVQISCTLVDALTDQQFTNVIITK